MSPRVSQLILKTMLFFLLVPSLESHYNFSPRFYKRQSSQEILTSSSFKEGNDSLTSPGERFHLSGLTLKFCDWTLDLTLNTRLLPSSYFEKKHVENGDTVVTLPGKHAELCHYQGVIRGVKGSWAALSTCINSVSGLLFDGQTHFYIHNNTLVNSEKGKSISQCSSTKKTKERRRKTGKKNKEEEDKTETLKDRNQKFPKKLENTKQNRHKRQVLRQESERKKKKSQIGGPWNSNSNSRYVELLLVVDNKKYRDHGQDLQVIFRLCKDIANVMNGLYAPLNIYIALVGVVVWTKYDEISLSSKGDVTLNNFLHYRRNVLVKEHPNDNAQLLTGIAFDEGVVGKAFKGPICTYELSGGVNMWHSEIISLVATTVAHELGHNFGMEHDGEDCSCSDESCIMAPSSSSVKPSFWSSCSLEYLAVSFEHGMDYCLRNVPSSLFEGPVCGNGFLEEGEDCDCGLLCDNPCCDGDSCTLRPGSECAHGSCCDISTCSLLSQGTVCRVEGQGRECDLPEYCSGDSQHCPLDVFKANGSPCKSNRAYCYDGHCKTRSDQCRLLWGPSGESSDPLCYSQNVKGTQNGNCGHSWLTKNYEACEEKDVECGMLHCVHVNEKLEFGMEKVSIVSHTFINTMGQIRPCRTALIDLGLSDPDPGLVPNGVPCGNTSLCINQKCVSVSSLPNSPFSCPDSCNGHGICNSRGNCHCEPGYLPPHCLLYEGHGGGSVDSGPSGLSKSTSSLSLLWLLWFLIPVLTLGLCCCCCLLLMFFGGKGKGKHLELSCTLFQCLKRKESEEYDGNGNAMKKKEKRRGRCSSKETRQDFSSNQVSRFSKHKNPLSQISKSLSFPNIRKTNSSFVLRPSSSIKTSSSTTLTREKSLERERENVETKVENKCEIHSIVPPHSSYIPLLPLYDTKNNPKLAFPSFPLPDSRENGVKATRRPFISKPTLTNATPSASALISKSSSTGPSRSSILSKDKEKKLSGVSSSSSSASSSSSFSSASSSRAVFFNDPLTLPSPTNPNVPPLVHQSFFPPIKSPISIKSFQASHKEGGVSSSLGNLPFSSPQYKSEIPFVTNVISYSSPTESSEQRCSIKSSKKLKDSEKSTSIVRPMAPPPPRPETLSTTSKDPIYDTIIEEVEEDDEKYKELELKKDIKNSCSSSPGSCSALESGDLMKEILSEMDKKMESVPSEDFEIYSTLMRRNKGRNSYHSS